MPRVTSSFMLPEVQRSTSFRVRQIVQGTHLQPKLAVEPFDDAYGQADSISEAAPTVTLRRSVAESDASSEELTSSGSGDEPDAELSDISASDVPGFILGEPCTPYAYRFQAEAAWTYVLGSFVPYALGLFGTDTAALWAIYLDRSRTLPRPHQTLSGSTAITAGFTAHHKTAEAEEGLVDEVIRRVNGGMISVAPGTSLRMTLTAALGATTVGTMLNRGGSQEMSFDAPATTIPGNIAGGVGDGGPPGNTAGDPDTRDATGDVEILVTPATSSAPGTISVTPDLNFHVHDTVDFCPGNLGGAIARAETIPMSRLESTEATFGPVYAADVPFDVVYPGPGTPRTANRVPAPVPTSPGSRIPLDAAGSPPGVIPLESGPSRTLPHSLMPMVLGPQVLFDFDSAVVKPEGVAALTRLLPLIRTSSSTLVVGYTDSVGSDEYNLDLSTRRVKAVIEELVRQDPSLASRLRGLGLGEREPVAPNNTAAGRARNRRVEFVFSP